MNRVSYHIKLDQNCSKCVQKFLTKKINRNLRCKSESEESHIIVEEMIEGEEHSVEYYSENGIHQMIATSYYFSDPINRVEYGYLQDAILSRSMIEKIDTFMKSVLTALEINDGVTHTEFFITPEKFECRNQLACGELDT